MPRTDHIDNGATRILSTEPCWDCDYSGCRVIFSQNEVYSFERTTKCNREDVYPLQINDIEEGSA